jgi:GxxExxY protein
MAEIRTKAQYDALAERIIGTAIEVHTELGAGLLESVYEHCLAAELRNQGYYVSQQMCLPIIYKGHRLDKEFIVDLVVENSIIVELKTVETLNALHEAQLLTYIKLADKRLGLLLNFNSTKLAGTAIRRKIYGHIPEA